MDAAAGPGETGLRAHVQLGVHHLRQMRVVLHARKTVVSALLRLLTRAWRAAWNPACDDCPADETCLCDAGVC